MRHQNDADSGLGQRAHRFPQAVLRENIQAVARLVEQQRLRIVDQRTRNQDALGFAGRHFRDWPVGQVRHAEPFQHRRRRVPLQGFDRLMIENARAAEESGEDHFASAGFAGDVLHQIV